MILDKLYLKNFCLYEGEQLFELNPSLRDGKHVPITLFGGINGGGKTTLLDAVQLVLYGKRARCSKRGNKTYEQFLLESIHHGREDTGAYVRLTFSYTVQGQQHLYDLTRSWKVRSGHVRDNLEVIQDGAVSEWLSENWNQIVEDLIPLGIAQLCFFDAEKIRLLTERDHPRKLGAAIKSLLGLDLAEKLTGDVAVLEDRIIKEDLSASDSEVVGQIAALGEVEEIADKQIHELLQVSASLENDRLAAAERLRAAEAMFEESGGLHWELRQKRQFERVELQKEREKLIEGLLELSRGALPLQLVSEALGRIQKQATVERKGNDAAIISSMLERRDVEILVEIERLEVPQEHVGTLREFLGNDRTTRLSAGLMEEWLELSEPGRFLVGHLREHGLRSICDAVRDLLTSLRAVETRLEDVQRSLAAAPAENEIRTILAEVKDASKQFERCHQKVRRLGEQLDSARRKRLDISKQLKDLRRRIADTQIQAEENRRILGLLAKTESAMAEFMKRSTAKKMGMLSDRVTESFSYLLRKQTLVTRVEIDPQSFAVTLFDDQGKRIARDRLSEGEKQIFAISLLWGLSRAAARPLPIIIDTPMARLDARHRQLVVEKYFPYASHQVIILSTDTEVDQSCFQQLEPHIARAYHLDYSETEKTTHARLGYFWDDGIAVEASA